MKRQPLLLALLAAAFSLSVFGLSAWPSRIISAQSAAPRDASTLRLAGLRERVVVRRDERGVPYIEAANEADLYFAQGYVTASDRLWQMDLLRRTARGELAELFGKTALEEDKRHRIYGFAKLSEQVAAKLPNEGRAALEAYAKGVNAFIASRDEKTWPAEFRLLQYQPRPWTPADSVVVGSLMAETLSTTWQTDLMRAALSDLPPERVNEILPEFSPFDTPVVGSDQTKTRTVGGKQAKRAASETRNFAAIVSNEILRQAIASEELMRRSRERVGLYAEDLAASNNWVVSGRRTASGKPLLANDPHLAPSAPSIWYLMHLSAPGLRVAGVTVPGLNGIVIGHNDRIAWGMTNLGPDVQDLYLEKFDPENPRRYLTPAGWKEAEVRREEIRVRKSLTDPATETVTIDVTVTRHGPIVLERGQERYALRWTMLDPQVESVTAFYRLNRARNWKEFCDALKTFHGPTQNIVYADVDGHIGYYGAGYIPMRRSSDGSVPYDGSKDDGEWTGYIPFDKLPHLYDPPSGMIVTANARVVGRDYPYHLTHGWASPHRQRRIHDLLSAKNKLTADDFRAIQGDIYAMVGATFAREVVKLFGGNPSPASSVGNGSIDAEMREPIRLFAEWDGQAAPDSPTALLISEMGEVFFNRLLVNAIGEERARQYRWGNRHTLLERLITEWPQQWLPKEYTSWQDFLRACHREARANLTKRLGADETKWTFGQAVQARFNHPLAAAPLVGEHFRIAPFPQRGSASGGGLGPTVNVGSSVSMRLIADPSNWDSTQQGIALGASGDPASPHYKDQLEEWRNVTPRAFPFSRQAVEKAAKQTLTLIP
jgi:penicillin amidase